MDLWYCLPLFRIKSAYFLVNKMLSPELIKKIAYIEIYTKRLLSSSMVGDSRSAQKGSGFEFSQIREYQMGDDVRFVDWHASARCDKLLVKEYIEERNRTIIIALDVSSSTSYSSSLFAKMDVMKQVAAVLSIVAAYGKDRIGLLLYSEDVELLIPPSASSGHSRLILETIFNHRPQGKGTNVGAACQRLLSLKSKNSLIILISDFLDTSIDPWVKLLAPAYEILAVRCLDPLERTMPNVGFLTLTDIETGQECVIDARKKWHKNVANKLEARATDQLKNFKKYGIDYLDLVNNETFVGDVIRFFRRRMSY